MKEKNPLLLQNCNSELTFSRMDARTDACTQPFYCSLDCLGQPGWAGTRRYIL